MRKKTYSRTPVLGLASNILWRTQVLGFHADGVLSEIRVVFGDGNHVGHLDDAFFYALHLVTTPGRYQQKHHVDHVNYGMFGLTHTYAVSY